MCGEKLGGRGVVPGKWAGIVVSMSLVRTAWRGWESGGVSQREDPGIFVRDCVLILGSTTYL
jgi:hypothetical protein